MGYNDSVFLSQTSTRPEKGYGHLPSVVAVEVSVTALLLILQDGGKKHWKIIEAICKL